VHEELSAGPVVFDYGDDVEGYSWTDIYPCPVTGCWIDVSGVGPGPHALWCGQAACRNPGHRTAPAPPPTSPPFPVRTAS
jgi:hypothetical protein